MVVPGRELLVCLVLVAGEELRGGAEGAGAGSQSHWGLNPGPDDGSSDEAGRANGARCDTEDGQGRHVGSGVLRPGVNGLGGEGKVDGRKGGGRSVVLAGWILRVVWCWCLVA